MYGNYKNRPRKGKKKKGSYMSLTKKAYLAGVKAGKRIVRKSRSKRWY